MSGSGGESERHRDLKRRALLWAQAAGFAACAVEVRVPRSGFRADLVACSIPRLGEAVGESVIFECKQSRADLLRDTGDEQKTCERLREVSARREQLEGLLGLHLPDLRRGESLFPEYDICDIDGIRHDGLRRVRREQAQLQSRLHAGTKFDRMVRYRCAERHYLVVSPGVLEPHEVPASWGLLEAADGAGAAADESGLAVRRLPERVPVEPASRLALLEAIALAGTRRLNAEMGLEWRGTWCEGRGTGKRGRNGDGAERGAGTPDGSGL